MTLLGVGTPPTAGGDAAATTAFLARVAAIPVTLDGTHLAAYKALINGLMSDSIFASLDALYILSTQSSATGDNMHVARLNLISTSYSLTGTGMTFVADRGVTDAGGAAFFDTGFTPSTAGGVYALNDAHLSVWANGTGANQSDMGYGSGGPVSYVGMSAAGGVIAINQGAATAMGATAGNGFFLGQRTASNAIAAYTAAPNAGTVSPAGTASTASTSLTSGSIGLCVVQGINYSGRQISAGSIGKSMSPTDIEKFYDRLQAFMTAVGN